MAEGDGAAQVFKEIKISFDEFAESFNQYADKLKETEETWKQKQGIWKSMSTDTFGFNAMEKSAKNIQQTTKAWSVDVGSITKNMFSMYGIWKLTLGGVNSTSQALIRMGLTNAPLVRMGGRGPSIRPQGEEINAPPDLENTLRKIAAAGGKFVQVLTKLAEFGVGAYAGTLAISGMAANRARRAGGLGAGIGSMTAAEIGLARYVDPDSVMASMRSAKFDITSPEYVALRAGL